ncbi:molybdenum cofactor biosynthesis protein 1 isoform X2 [Aphidius gifuensis]|uniref:molybdenum cofactor biosynthesis protein 1 isoform X2 n=1 Tax=Aphidius gifuensis TaxID=684658 RepID=UPI001CDC269C|nr:molybdenum cofactor biosynthesis protein 1 isoform X2 [Aphidius gifuensis]
MFIGKSIFRKIDKRYLSSKASLIKPKITPRIENFRNKLKLDNTKILTDSFGRHHTYLRISLTEKCNLRCVYCMPAEGVKLTKNDEILTIDEILRISKLFVKNGVKKIRLTGGEPTVRRDIIQIIKELKNIKGLDSVGITTNGLTLTRQLPSLINAGIDGLNISLDTLKKERFDVLTRRQGWNRVMSSIDLAIQLKFSPIKINCVVMKNFNDDEIIDFVDFTRNHPVDVRFIEYMPFFGNNWEKYKMLSFNEMKNIIRNKYPNFCSIKNDDNSTSKGYCVPGFEGTVGFITSMSEHFCYSCNRLRITADGNLKVCLFEGKSEISLKNYMRNGASDEELEEIINIAVLKKKKKHAGMSNLKEMENRPMILIGG